MNKLLSNPERILGKFRQEGPLIHPIICGAGGVGLVTAPGILQRSFFQNSPHRISVDVGGKFQKIRVSFTENGLVPPLKKVAPGLIFQMVMAGIPKLQAWHDFRKMNLLDFDQKMNVGGHKDIGEEKEGITLFVFFQEPQITFVIWSGFENLGALIPPGDDLIKSSGKMNPRLPTHDQSL
jgi:hypothetical protein